MKLIFQYPVSSCSGKRGDSVFASYQNGTVCIQRVFTYPTLTENNELLGDISQNLSAVYASFDAGWIADLATYANRLSVERGPGFYPVNKYCMYTKMWYAVHTDDPTIDLKTVTFADINLLGISIQTVAEAIEYRFLPEISNYEDLTAPYNGG